MTQRRPRLVRDDRLLWRDDDVSQAIRIGTRAWYDWLAGATSFSFESSDGKFNARKERVQRGGEYWKAHRRSHGKLLHSYLGKSEDLTLDRLIEIARLLARRAESLEGIAINKDTEAPAQQCRVDWGEAGDGGTFYGRREEMAQLEEWILGEDCRLITLFGMGGIGKTVLATRLAQNLRPAFDFIFWRSLLNAPSIEDILTEGIAFLSGPQDADEVSSLSKKMEYFLNALRASRCLIVLDNVEAALQGSSQGRAGHYREGYEAYGTLVRLIGEATHHSCLVLTSREKPKEVGLLEGKHSPVRSLPLPPLEEEACQHLLQGRRLVGPEESWQTLISYYAGNPLALKLVAGTIEEVFRGSIQAFIQQGDTLLGDIRDLLDQQFEQLSIMERSLLYWLAIEREAVVPESLFANVVTSVSKFSLLEALDYLVQRRGWIEKGETRTTFTFTLQSVIMQYVTDRLIDQAYEDIASESMSVFLSHALVKAQAKDEVRLSQIRFILEPLANRLLATWGRQRVQEKVMSMLFALRERYPQMPGYAGGNALHLLCQLKSDLRNIDFSDLTIWQAYLRGVNLRDVNFSRCDLATSVFTETFGNVTAVAFSPDAMLLAAGTTNGETRVWQVTDGKPLLACGDSTNGIMSVAFHPTGRLLASGGNDDTIKLWDLHTGQCLSTLRGHAGWVRSVAFHPDGTLLASGSDDQTIRLWDLRTGEAFNRLFDHSGYVVSVAFHPTGRLLASGGSDHTIKLWDVHAGQCLSTLRGHTGCVRSVAFHPDGTLLASGSDDQSDRLWRIEEGENRAEYLRTLQGHSGSVWSVAFSPNGRMLASGSYGQVIKLWEVEEKGSGYCVRTLQGYRDDVWSVAFSPDGRMLASGSDDQSIKLWDMRSGQCLTTLRGHTYWVRFVTFSPDGKMLASGSYDQSIKLWDISTGQCLATCQGHSGRVWSIAFSPDGKMLASSGNDDQGIKLWDVSTGQSGMILQGHTDLVRSVAFSPDGRMLASGSYDQSIKLWDISTGQCLATLRGHSNYVLSVAFSSDSKTLASGSSDQSVRLWDVHTGQCHKTLQEHSNAVRAVAFSPMSDLLASGSQDETIKVTVQSSPNGFGWVRRARHWEKGLSP